MTSHRQEGDVLHFPSAFQEANPVFLGLDRVLYGPDIVLHVDLKLRARV